MHKKILLLVAGFIIVFYLVHAAYDLPDIVNGKLGNWLPAPGKIFSVMLKELSVAFPYTLLPYILLWHFYPGRKIILCVLSILTALGIWFFFHYQFESLLTARLRFRNFFSRNLFFICVYVLYAVIFYFVRYAQFKELEQKEILLQNRQAELSFLHSQINPHFLFNNLNNIYSLVYEASPKALPAIAGLSELLRYMLYDSTQKVPLQKEMDYIRKYIDLQSLRFEHPVKISLEENAGALSATVPPLLLVPFVENAYKHGNLSAERKGIVLRINGDIHQTYFYCSNEKGKIKKDKAGGIGLTNVRRRLELLYPAKHTLSVEETDEVFTVQLQLIHD